MLCLFSDNMVDAGTSFRSLTSAKEQTCSTASRPSLSAHVQTMQPRYLVACWIKVYLFVCLSQASLSGQSMLV